MSMILTPAWIVGLALSTQAPAPAPAAGGAPVIDISGAHFQALPLAIPEVKLLKGGAPGADGNPIANDPAKDAASAATKVLRDDLAMAGVFKVLDPAGYLPNAQKEGLVLGSFNMGDWTNIGASVLVKAGLSREGGKSTVEAHVFDVATGREVLTPRYSGDESAERTLVHRVADDIFQHFTREPGVFRTKIAAIRKGKGGKKDLFIVGMDGSGGRNLNLEDGLNLLPAWDPDGRSLLFTTYLKGNPDLYRVNADGTGVTRLSNRPGVNMGGAASPDGRYIAVTLSKDGNSEIYLLDRNGGEYRRLTNDPQVDSSPSWSPDGKKLAFVSARGGSPQIYVMDVDTGDKGARRLTFQGNYNQTPEWSPRGDKIAFTARDERAVWDIFVVDVATNKVDRLTQDQGNNEEPSWAPNGRLLTFTSTRTGRSQLFIMTPDGNFQKQILSDTSEYSTPAWGPLVKGD